MTMNASATTLTSYSDSLSVVDTDPIAKVQCVSEDDYSEKTVLSLFWFGGKLGGASYDLSTYELSLMSDGLDGSPHFVLLNQVINQVDPAVILVSAKQDDRFLQAVDKTLETAKQSSENPKEAKRRLILQPSINFAVESSKRRIMGISMPSMAKLLTDVDRAIYLTSLINFDYQATIRALGALLRYLDKHHGQLELETKGFMVPITAINNISLNNIVTVDNNTFSALQIFQKEFHPSVYKMGTGTKEGLSLFGIFNRCKSALGSKELRCMMMRPTYDMSVLQYRHSAIAFLIRTQNIEVFTSLQNCLKNIKNIPTILARMTNAEASVKDWQALYKTLYNAIYIGDICKAQPQQIGIFAKIANAFTDELYHVASIINKIVDFDEMVTQNRFTVKWGVDETLDQKKQTYNGLPDFMSKVAEEELKKLPQIIPECNVIYLPQLGYLLGAPLTEEMEVRESYELPGLEFVFTSNKIVYYRSASTKELDKLLGDTQYEITDHETQIMLRLQALILEHCDILVEISKCLSELDCMLLFSIIALTLVAKDYNYVQPSLTTENVIQIKKGRHPLQELCVNAFVPNDTNCGGEYSRIKLLTGPNASGKSVYLKQVALIMFMVHIGSFVPAESAEIGLIHSIFTRIQTLESVSVGLSTFMIDLNQMTLAVQQATDRSLVIIDEFGKGTNNVDGLSLLTACLCHWLDKDKLSPHVLVSTHFHGVVNLLPQHKNISLLTMDIIKEEDNIVYLYQLVEGCLNSSFAIQVAIQAGLPESIIKHANEVTEALCHNKPFQCKEKDPAELKKCIQIAKSFLQLDLKQAGSFKSFLEEVVKPMLNETNQ